MCEEADVTMAVVPQNNNREDTRNIRERAQLTSTRRTRSTYETRHEFVAQF